MSNSEPANNIVWAMYKTLDEAIAQGDCAAAIQRLDSYIGGIADNDPGARASFGSNLMVMYATRARLRYESGAAEAAKEDVHKSQASLDVYYSRLDSAQKENLRAWIPFVTSAEAQQRGQAMEIINHYRGFSPAQAPTGTAPADTAQSPARPDNRPPANAPAQPQLVQKYLIPFLAGATAWAVPVILVAARTSGGKESDGAVWLAMICLIVVLVLSFQGWDWLKGVRVGTNGAGLKVIALLLICTTFFGLVFPIFWTGKRILELVKKSS